MVLYWHSSLLRQQHRGEHIKQGAVEFLLQGWQGTLLTYISSRLTSFGGVYTALAGTEISKKKKKHFVVPDYPGRHIMYLRPRRFPGQWQKGEQAILLVSR